MEGANKINSAGKNAAREATEAVDKSESINIYLYLVYFSRIILFKTDFFKKRSVYFLKIVRIWKKIDLPAINCN